ncbi:MAG: prephenate dehydratase [Candidatus Omnitrophica bacterium]|nr:prephenate dehydratase [Candidatus Omnitrophota bacterium]
MSLNNFRKKIDQIDEKVIKLLNERAEMSQSIGRKKLESNTGIYAPAREKEIFDNIKKLNQGPMTMEAFEAIYREIMSSSLALEKSIKIAYLGIEGSYTHLAANKKFGSQVGYSPCNSVLDVFQQVENDECEYGVVPIENSTEGVVTHTIDMLVDSELKICAQIYMKISHNLISKSAFSQIKKIYSNPQVFGQCRNWLHKNMPSVSLIPVESTSKAAQLAANENGAAAISSGLAAKIYKLKILKSNIQDIAHNTTRFLVISKQDVPSTGKDRTTIIFSIKDKVGALHAMLTPFYQNKINLTKIESRPSKKRAWDYYFFVDFEGHRSDRNVKLALNQLENMCKYLKIVGSYPSLD